MKLKFLGTGGGRFVTGEQKRRTAGIILTTDEARIHVDPGPGALVYTHDELEQPLSTDAVLVSHGHLDHRNDAEALIEMITEGAGKPGAVFANRSCLKGYGDLERCISEYHQHMCSRVELLEDGSEFDYKDMVIQSQEMFHSDPKTQGFILDDGESSIGFWTDTEYSDELAGFYSECDTLVVYCTLPRGKSVPSHTGLDDVPDLVEKAGPKTVILTHFGYAFLESDMDNQKNWLEEQVDAKVVFAEDGMEFPGDAKLSRFTS